LIDDVDVRDLPQESVRDKIGFVPQAPILFSGTINDNMRFGKKDATEEEITHALTVEQAIDFVSKMPEQYETQIAQGGTNVSGGQKQRLSIARAIIRKPEIYIFDDSFSALDFKTDAALRKALKKETRDATVLIVAQRVSSIMDADRIVVLNEGKIVGIGKHRELLKNCDVYREICSSQLSEEELA
jgi:ATP-binding cassette subfamily B protein